MSDGETRPKYRWRPWKVAGVAIAVLLLVGGGVLALTEKNDDAAKPDDGTRLHLLHPPRGSGVGR